MATAKKKSTKKSTKKLNIKIKMIGDLIDVTGSSKDSWNPAEISDDMKAISYIRKLADSWNTAQLNEALKYLGFKTVDTWNAAELEETKNKLVKYFLPNEATGNPITLNTYGNLPYEVSKAEVTFLPKQSGSGEPSPDNVRPIIGWTELNLGRCGKNLCNPADMYIFNQNRYFATNNYTTRPSIQVAPNTQYILSCRKGVVPGDYSIYYWDREGEFISRQKADPFTTPSNCVGISFYCGYGDGDFTDVDNVKAQVEEGSIATPYEPYNGQTYTETLGATYYGGKVDFVSGEGSEEWDYIASYDGETLPGEWISDRDAYAPGTTPTTGAEVAYKLSEAVELTLTPQEIELLKGQNVIWTDGDDILIEYKALLNS